jgi:glycosyltransferase involved in cell wall biosynthesis
LRVLVVNSFNYPRGGDCVHALALEESLKAAGHEVAVFAMQHAQNQPSPWQEYWPENVEYGERLGLVASARAAVRSMYSMDVARRLRTLLATFRPDVAHLHSVHHHLTVSVVDALWDAGVPAVWTLHDYRVVCPATHLLRDEEPCTLCRGGRYWHCMIHGCKGASRMRSFSASVESYLSTSRGVYRDRVARFIAPSKFLARTVVCMGIPATDVTVIPNPLAAADWSHDTTVARGGALYVGRLSREKGVDGLLRAHARAGLGELRIIGDGPEGERLRLLAARLGTPVRFGGWLDGGAVREAIDSAAVLCVPSTWYENCPTVILEALAMRTPVMASKLGGLTELLDDGRCGILVAPGDERAWAAALHAALSEPEALVEKTDAGRKRVLERHDPAQYLRRLEGVYDAAVSRAVQRRRRS